MCLTKKEKEEVLKVYDTWLHSYLEGDVETYDFYLDDAYHFIGSTDNEDFLGREDTTQFFQETADQLAGKTRLRNKKRIVEKFDQLIFITEIFDADFLHGDEWNYYGKFRFTSVLQKKNEGWRFIYQHFSMPDTKAQEGETLGTEQISKENQELRDAVKRRTAELEHKNREMNVEAALERIRAQSMMMQHSSELDSTSRIFHKQLLQLGIETEFSYLWLPDVANGKHKFWASWTEQSNGESNQNSKSVIYDLDRTEPYTAACFAAWESDKQLHIEFIPPQDVSQFFETWPELIEGAKEHRSVKYPDGLYYAEAYMKYGCFGINIRRSLTDFEENILLRFSIEFERTYTRYLDLKMAEEQAREAQIEAALERVRSRTMAMHHSDELPEVANVLFHQVHSLGIPAWSAGYCILAEDQRSCSCIMSSEGVLQSPFHLPFTEEKSFKPWLKAIQYGESFLVQGLSGKDIEDHYKYLLSLPGVAEQVDDIADAGFLLPTYQINHLSFFGHGFLLFITYEKVPEAHAIFKRFTQVFEQSYTRFLDLQKAEAQAREAQIEVALERVRTHAMAMHTSEELINVATVMYDEFKNLGVVQSESCSFVIIDEKNNTQTFWGSRSDSDLLDFIVLPLTGDVVMDDRYAAWKRKETIYCQELGGKELRDHVEFVMPEDRIPEEVRRSKRSIPDPTYFYFGNFSHGYLQILASAALSEEQQSILARLTGVFEMTYRRFLDLQKAEAQTREAQIEAALERLRARSMAMHNSDELREVVAVMYEQLDSLNISRIGCELILCDQQNDQLQYWASNIVQSIHPEPYDIPRSAHWFFEKQWKAWKEKKERLVIVLKGKQKHEFNKFIFENTAFKKFPEDVKNFILSRKEDDVFAHAIMKYGLLEAVDEEPWTESKFKILQRFAAVFEQAYTRFLDLKKAEEQAREAQIELSLERVRARSMAMHKSEELAEVASVLFKQLNALGVHHFASGFVIFDKDKPEGNMWMSFQGEVSPKPFQVDFEISPLLVPVYKSWKDGKPFYINKISGKQYLRHFQLLEQLFGNRIREAMEKIGQTFEREGREIPDHTVMHHTFFKHGSLLLNHINQIEEQEILNRFAKVFEQTYTRFMDLQKAEAQAREAQIEIALERVRSRTMGMQHSDELGELSYLLDQQVRELGIQTWGCAFNIYNEEENTSTEWFANENGLVETYIVPREKIFLQYYEKGQRGVPIHVEKIGRDIIGVHYQYLCTLPVVGDKLIQLKESGVPFPEYQVDHVAYFKYGYLLFITLKDVPEAHDVFVRFAKVFEQTYTRFLDLKKAEAQAREAQIELSLERIRAQALAMRESSDLLDIVVAMRKEFVSLGYEAHYFWHMRWLPKKYEKAMTSGDGTRIGMIMELPRHIHGDIEFLAKWEKSDEPTVVYVMNAEGAIAYVDKMVALGDFKQIDPNAPSHDDIRHIGGLTFVMARTTHGEIGYSLPGEVPDVTEEDKATLVRFAGAFDLAYRRFEDLQATEIRNREARIELALERVRARTMAMQHSDELAETSSILFQELDQLGIETTSCGFVILNRESKFGQMYFSVNGKVIPQSFSVPQDLDHYMVDSYNHWLDGHDFLLQDMAREELKKHNLALQTYFNSQGIEIFTDLNSFYEEHDIVDMEERQLVYQAFFTHGVLLFVHYKPVPEIEVLKRFAKVFDQTYTRFLDLQTAEKQAYQARIETALERVRARALAMQQPEELKEVAEVLRNEMGKLQVEELETCSIYIVGDSIKNVECWFALKDIRENTKQLVNDHFELDLNDTWVGREMIRFFKSEEEKVSIVMKGESRVEWIRYCEVRSKPFRGYYGEVIPERTYHLYRFSNGYMGFASAGNISSDSWDILKRAAAAFTLAYSRFQDLTKAREDLQRLKEEKQRAETALIQLKSTQSQLIQAEKMASLGELTAGIAHEIQNPLNFVNNFSELNDELIGELKEELENGDFDEVKAMLQDLSENEKKIAHHGKRAEGIVRSMLQHSRISKGEKESTDMNALCDEYTRLAFHGMRARDKSFNADFELDPDPNLPKIEVIAQDIGRVLLNLINNAFYAVAKQPPGSAGGLVKIKTQYQPPGLAAGIEKGQIRITISDNGPGIPSEIKDKIFQPFFTTKPTGQGTGLGLSLAYDIVKAHSGELRVETEEGKGTEFIIFIPY